MIVDGVASFFIINLTVCFQDGVGSTRVRWNDSVLHAISFTGGETGFIPLALLIFQSGSNTGDDHTEINAGNFTR
jgi:hypothetical protein